MDESLSVPLVEALSDAWSAIRRRHPQVPPVVILAAPNMHSNRGVLGHFAALRWSATDGPGGSLHEVVVVAEHLNRSAADIFETVLHEAAHAMNFAAGIYDCSRSQYHNKHFKLAAEMLGLRVDNVPHYGWALTTLAATTEAEYAEVIAHLDGVLIHRKSLLIPRPRAGTDKEDDKGGDPPSGPGTRECRSRKATCPCGFIIRVAKKTLDDTVIRCDTCGDPFVLT